jgi:prevent-host-death family protein
MAEAARFEAPARFTVAFPKYSFDKKICLSYDGFSEDLTNQLIGATVSDNPVTELINALSARTRFGNLLDRLEQEKVRFLVSKKGKPRAVILSVEDYMKIIGNEDELLARVQLETKKG